MRKLITLLMLLFEVNAQGQTRFTYYGSDGSVSSSMVLKRIEIDSVPDKLRRTIIIHDGFGSRASITINGTDTTISIQGDTMKLFRQTLINLYNSQKHDE